jgi:ATP-binding cassette subfamily F protein 3
MPLLSFSGVAVEYGATRVFDGVTFSLEPRQRLGLVGPNGAGKSTVLRLAEGSLSPSAGRVDRRRGLRLRVLSQFDADFGHATVLDQALVARQDLLDFRHQLHALEQRLAAGESTDALLHEYGEVQASYDHGGGYTLESRAREILGGLGFLDQALEQDPSALSGGWRRRLQLAQLLMQEADVFLLDEPTNHLDVASIEWLEEFLRGASQAMLIVSHDRRFLDNVAGSILELEAGQGYQYPGSYSKFVQLRAARRREQQRQYETQQEYISHQEAFIQRYKAGQRAREARGRATRLERMERVEAPPDDKEIRIRFGGPASAALPLQSRGLLVGYDARPLLSVPAFEIAAGQRVAIVGPNGSGKTTLLRTLEGGLRPLGGSVGYGARVLRSYYDQHLGDLPEDSTLIEVLAAAHPIDEESARHHLARLLFRGDEVFKKVRQLSGGERSRLALARLMLDQGNLLFLDEPTNHLDLPSQEVLQEALLEFPGTLVFVSHDRELIDRLATQTWWIAPVKSAAGEEPASIVEIAAGGYLALRQGTAGARRP